MPDATYYLPPVGGAGGHVPRAGLDFEARKALDYS